MDIVELICTPPILQAIERHLSKRQILRLICLCHRTIAAAKYSAIFDVAISAEKASKSIFAPYFRRIQIKSHHGDYLDKFAQNVEICGPPPMGDYLSLYRRADKMNGMYFEELLNMSAFANLKYLTVTILHNADIRLPRITELKVANITSNTDLAAMFPNLEKFIAEVIPPYFKLPPVHTLHIMVGTFTVPESVKVLYCGSPNYRNREQHIRNLKLDLKFLRIGTTYFSPKANMNDIHAETLEISSLDICYFHALPRAKYLRVCDYMHPTAIERRNRQYEIIELRNSAGQIKDHGFTKEIEIPIAADYLG